MKSGDEEVVIVLSEEDKAILAEAEQLAKTKKEPKTRKEPFSDGPIDGKPRTFKIGLVVKPVEKPTANPIHIASEMPKDQTIYVPIAQPEFNQVPSKEEKFEPTQTKTENDAIKKSGSVEGKLRNIYMLQLLDSKLDKLKASKHGLPQQIAGMKVEIEDLNEVLSQQESLKLGIEERIKDFKEVIKNSESEIKDFKQKMSKSKGAEKEFFEKEMEFQELEIELQKKHILQAEKELREQENEIQAQHSKIKERQGDLKAKEKDLAKIISETETEEANVITRIEDQRKRVDTHFLERYDRLRKSTSNGLAVVPVERDASTGSFIQIPAQIKMNVQSRKRIITDEHSGRILVDDVLSKEEEFFLNQALKKGKK
ncbi:MAG: zinc ribbon domain-containing protein [Bacteroidota bacterium]